jgi:hypothetical protein
MTLTDNFSVWFISYQLKNKLPKNIWEILFKSNFIIIKYKYIFIYFGREL